MKLSSLRLQLLAAAGLGIAVALVLAGLAIGIMFTKGVERSARTALLSTISRLIAAIDPDAPARRLELTRTLSDPRYETPYSGIYWQITDIQSLQALRSRSLWDHVLKVPQALEGRQFSTIVGPIRQQLLALSWTIHLSLPTGKRSYQIIVAQDRSTIDEAIVRFSWELAAVLLIVGAALGTAAILQVQLGLSSFKRLHEDVKHIRTGASASIDANYPLEIAPLVSEVNELLASQQTSLKFARCRADDLAHGMKTPLAVLGTIAYELEKMGDRRNAELILELTNDMSDRVDYQMRLVRLRQRVGTHQFCSSLSCIVRRTVKVLQKTRQGEQIVWIADIADGLKVNIDSIDLVELVGVIMENAVKWAEFQVSIQANENNGTTELRISNDGPGIQPSDLQLIGERNRRFDRGKPGTGLGLAIASEIVYINNGIISFKHCAHGGLEVAIRFPTARC